MSMLHYSYVSSMFDLLQSSSGCQSGMLGCETSRTRSANTLTQKIEADNPKSVQHCCAEMFAEWLSQDKAASWSTLMDALTGNCKSVAKRKLAETLGTRYS